MDDGDLKDATGLRHSRIWRESIIGQRDFMHGTVAERSRSMLKVRLASGRAGLLVAVR